MTRGRKPKPDGTIRTRTDGTIQEKRGKKWVYIGCISKAGKKDYNFPPIKIPPNMVPTEFPGYYITEEGDAYREPVYGERMPINENGLVYLKPAFRGHNKYPEKQYYCVNITIKDENGKKKQIKRSNHQLVAKAFCPNPEGHTEILHGDRGHRCNHYTNLKWGTHLENMEGVIGPCTTPKPYKITDTRTGQIWEGINVASWVREHYDLIAPRIKSPDKTVASIQRNLSGARSSGNKIWGFIVENGGESK